VSDAVEVSVVVPTHNRREDLARCLAALRAQRTERTHEIVVVDDGSEPPLRADEVAPARLLRTAGGNPGAARNAGIADARGAIVAFTDDDTEPAPGWLEAAAAHLEANQDGVAVHGPVDSPPWDPLAGHSIELQQPGAYYTCNIAYRREALERLGGFSGALDTYHGEDVDLGFRALKLGAIGWAPAMAVVHHPRALTLGEIVRRGRFAPNEIVVFRRHAEHYRHARRLPPYAFPYANIAYVWGGQLARELPGLALRPRRLARLLAIAAGQAAFATWALARFALAERRRLRGGAVPGQR
jgi:GT2 family glycosyltransferase